MRQYLDAVREVLLRGTRKPNRTGVDTISTFLVGLLLSSCTSFQRTEERAWRRDGACSVVCDYRRGYMSAARTVSPVTCRCITPQARAFNEMHSTPLDVEFGNVHCAGGCVAEAEAILKRQPWRRPKNAPPFDDPYGDLVREISREQAK